MRIIECQIPVENIVDALVTQNVLHTNHDDYQLIKVQPTTAGKTRELLDALPGKSQASFTIFIDTLKKYCPQVLERCSARPRPPKTRLGQLQELLTARRKSTTTMRGPTPWLGSKGKLHTHMFSLDLVIADRDDLAKSMTERSSTTATEQTRRDDHYARPRARKTIPFQSLFCLKNPSQQRTDPVQATTSTSGQTVAAAAEASSSAAPDVVVSRRQEASTGTQSLCTHPKTAVWAGAGCGKTGTCQHVAMLHSEGQLWPFFGALLLWRLREPAVQSATSLVQLLAILLPDEPESKLQEFADDIRAREGRGILAVLDGVDEFVERNNSYVCRLLTGDVLTEACLLATSRPCDAARIFFQSASSVFDANVELLGFSEQQVDAFIDESLGSELAPKLKELLDKSPSLASLMSVPLLAVLVSQVFESSPDRYVSLSTRTRLYSALMLLVLRHAVNENRIELSDVEKVRLKAAKDARQLRVGVAKKLLTDHAKVAWSAHKENKAIFDTDFIVDEGEWESLGPLAVGLLDCYISAGGDLTEVRQYSFQHLTMQEYLSAFYLAETMSDDDALQATMTSLCKDTHSYVVLQFLAGLLEKKHHSVFFSHLNQWLHDPHLRDDDDVRRERLRVCLLCAQEACGGDVDSFPDQLKLPKRIFLYHVTATDLTILTAAVKNSSTINDLQLWFDSVRKESDSASVSRVKRQTRSAMTSLTTAVSKHPSLRRVAVHGPMYSLLEGKSLANLVVNNRLVTLSVYLCGIGDTEVSEFSSELKHTTLTKLYLSGNMISDAGMYALADALQHNRTVQELYLRPNGHSEEAASRLRQQLAHIKHLFV